jgi:hypothetical protein
MKEATQFTRKSANILLEAAELQERKGQDYQNPLSRVRQADHYPRGVYTILDTINGKMLRMYSVLETMEQGGNVNFESVEDSAIDMINYASFLVAYMRGDIDGQEMGKDIFNRRTSKETHPTTALYPAKFRQIHKEVSTKDFAIGPSTTNWHTNWHTNQKDYIKNESTNMS